jgi:prepilin-type N-terminal cleavage/methylation domain-containing protein
MKTPIQTTQYRKKSGFTLIEIVIVLAIAALIMVIVFVAVQGAQRSRRDAAMRAAATRAVAALVSCAGNNSGAVNSTACGSYVSGVTYPTTATVGSYSVTAPTANTSVTASGGTCATPTATAASPGSVQATYWNEASGAKACVESTF